MSRGAVVVALALSAVMAGFATPAVAQRQQTPHAQKLRTAINFPDDCTFIAEDSEKPAFTRENACAEAFARFAEWPTADCPLATPDSTCVNAAAAQRAAGDVSNGPGGSGPPRKFECDNNYAWAVRNGGIDAFAPLKFLPLAPGEFLVELDCGGGAYNTRNAYLFYDETVTPPALKRLRFPYYNVFAFGNEETRKAVPKKIWVTVLSSRAFNRRRKELIVLLKGRGLGDFGSFARYVFRDGEPILREFRFKLEEDRRDAYSFSGDDPPSPKGWRRVPPE